MSDKQRRQGRYPDELRDRAVRMVLDHQHEYGSQWEAICSVAEKLGPKAETVRLWVRQAEADGGVRPGPWWERHPSGHAVRSKIQPLSACGDLVGVGSCARRRL